MRYPKIGIRPVIDGRWGGVRESLEEQTMGMANAAAKLISENVCYPDGTPVMCVVSDTTIGGGAEAAKCEEQFSSENVVATLSVTPCWCYGMETYDMNPKPLRLFGGLTQLNARVQYTLPLLWLLMRKRVCLHFQFTATMCRIKTTAQFLPM